MVVLTTRALVTQRITRHAEFELYPEAHVDVEGQGIALHPVSASSGESAFADSRPAATADVRSRSNQPARACPHAFHTSDDLGKLRRRIVDLVANRQVDRWRLAGERAAHDSGW